MGGSLAAALRRAGRDVAGYDVSEDLRAAALGAGIVTRIGDSVASVSAGADAVFVAVPVTAVPDAVIEALDAGAEVVTDVGSVKRSVVDAVEQARPQAAGRFVGGHPMAGSEQEGLGGADADLFRGATWVLTPTPTTAPDAFARVRALVSALGADVLAVEPEEHDTLVAVVSHVPHLAAGTLMLLAATEAKDRAALLRLAAGGFRDMTRIAAGHPGIWPDICAENREAIVATLDRYVDALGVIRSAVAGGDRAALLRSLESAREARINLPVGAEREGPFVELRIPVPDRPGVLAEVTTLAGQLGVNIVDLEIAHSLEGGSGVLVVVVAERAATGFVGDLEARGYAVASSRLP
jgi:prephenate dehydrogenase